MATVGWRWRLLLPFLVLHRCLGKDYYGILGVGREADAATIRRAYHRAALRCHPDKRPGDQQAQAEFLRVSSAYEVLGDPRKRAMYNAKGAYSDDDVDLAAALRIFLASLAGLDHLVTAAGMPDWDKIAESLRQMAEEVGKRVANHTKDVLANLTEGAQSLAAERIERMQRGFINFSEHAQDKLTNLTEMAGRAKKLVANLTEHVQDSVTNITDLAGNARQTVANFSKRVQNNVPNLTELARGVQQPFANVREHGQHNETPFIGLLGNTRRVVDEFLGSAWGVVSNTTLQVTSQVTNLIEWATDTAGQFRGSPRAGSLRQTPPPRKGWQNGAE